jgi:hypothetical protein
MLTKQMQKTGSARQSPLYFIGIGLFSLSTVCLCCDAVVVAASFRSHYDFLRPVIALTCGTIILANASLVLFYLTCKKTEIVVSNSIPSQPVASGQSESHISCIPDAKPIPVRSYQTIS